MTSRSSNALVIAAIAFLAQEAAAACIYTPCFAITFETLECKAEDDINDIFRGARLKIKPRRIREVACDPDHPDLSNDKARFAQVEKSSEYFYHLDSRDSCAVFRGKRPTLFLQRECCDTLPAEGACAKGVQTLKDLPPWAQ